jgi:hypothetical protein
MRFRARPRRILHSLALLALALPAPVCGQTILGRVLDQFSEQPVDGVIVSLVARTGEARATALSDSTGRFVLSPPTAGEYLLVTERFGYLETRSPLLSLTTEGEAPLDLMVAPAPIGLEGLEISVEERAAEELDRMGVSVNALGNRWIDKAQIDAIPVKRDMGTILERAAQAGIRVSRPENLTMGSDDIGLCVAFLRVRRADGGGRCALVVLNGVPMSGPGALDIDPYSIEGIALLEPLEAAVQYGTLAGAGAVLVWTTRGR